MSRSLVIAATLLVVPTGGYAQTTAVPEGNRNSKTLYSREGTTESVRCQSGEISVQEWRPLRSVTGPRQGYSEAVWRLGRVWAKKVGRLREMNRFE